MPRTLRQLWIVKWLVDALGALPSQWWCKPSSSTLVLMQRKKVWLSMSMTMRRCAQPWTRWSVPKWMVFVSRAFQTWFNSTCPYWTQISRIFVPKGESLQNIQLTLGRLVHSASICQWCSCLQVPSFSECEPASAKFSVFLHPFVM